MLRSETFSLSKEDEDYLNRLLEQNESREERTVPISDDSAERRGDEQRFATGRSAENRRYGGDDFWDFGEVRRKVYRKPDFGAGADEMILIDRETPESGNVAKRESVPQRRSWTTPAVKPRVADNVAVGEKPVRTAQYGSAAHGVKTRDVAERQNEALRATPTSCEYDCGNLLIRRVEIRPWTTNTQFYGRFAAEAALFHEKRGTPCPAVPFFSCVPQYAKMDERQQSFYLYVRECLRNGTYIEADLSYILLYIYEIINLPHKIPPERGSALLAFLWLHYRKSYPRLDVFLCEWLPDYCLIHQIPMPRELTPILPQIVQKAPFKEFFLDVPPEQDMENTARILMEFASDYDYRTSRYYPGNESMYDEKLRAAVIAALTDACREKRGIFSFEKKYRLTRDAYCGAVAPAEIKRRIDVEFYSFTRSLETRERITSLVRYAENRLRLVLKIRAKLGVGKLDPADREIIDRFFAPLMEEKPLSRAEVAALEEREYLKLYEAESVGFDLAAAEEIERTSWDNTRRLTFADTSAVDASVDVSEDESVDVSEDEPAEGESVDASVDESTASTADGAEKEAVRAALRGDFRNYCRANGLFDGDMASKINEIFLELIGDVVLLDENGEYGLIEDYREDVLEWLS